MKVEQINEILTDLSEWNLSKKFNKVASSEDPDYHRERDQGETSERVDIYKVGIEDWHLKVITESDSYGEDQGIVSVQFVKPIVKQITDFE
jgi:hypothetical protein